LKSDEARHAAVKHLARAKALLQGLLARGKTPERLSMMGSVSMRQAMLSTDARRAALEAMRDSYAEALKFAREGGPKARAYPLANCLAAQVVLGWQEPHTPAAPSEVVKASEAGLIDLKAVATELAMSSTDFWDLSAMADFKLLTALIACVLDPGQCEDVATEYIRAGLRGVLPRHRASMLDQIRFYRLMADTEAPADRRDDLIVGLDDLLKALKD
jgi:uncharacterized protein YejL (UPF0352 family)